MWWPCGEEALIPSRGIWISDGSPRASEVVTELRAAHLFCDAGTIYQSVRRGVRTRDWGGEGLTGVGTLGANSLRTRWHMGCGRRGRGRGH